MAKGEAVERPDWAPVEIDLERPSAARIYDYYLGGSHNFAVDREMAQQAIRIVPGLPRIMQANRAFLRRAVRYLTDQGIRQFLDIGSGIPTAGNVHEVVQRAAPDARVVYADNDAVAVAQSRAILDGDRQTTVVQADLRRPEQVIADPETRRLLDLEQPLGLLMVAVLHFVPDDDDPAGILAEYRDALAPGSHLVVSHGTQGDRPELGASMQALYARSANPLTSRDRDEIASLFAGFELVPPGVVYVPEWRPDPVEEADDQPERSLTLAGVGRKA
jgi:SAM-dependent methyltransferase